MMASVNFVGGETLRLFVWSHCSSVYKYSYRCAAAVSGLGVGRIS